ncbi:glycerophosphodiester phosphodiesterase family protein [Larkinella ripae]
MKGCVVFSVAVSLFLSSCKKEPVLTSPYQTNVIAHRGAWKTAGVPENSLASLQQAIRLGCYGSEFDVQMSSDSVLFIFHDNAVQGFSLENTPSSQLSALKLSNGESLPTLEAFLTEGVKQSKTRLVLELKGSRISRERSLATARKVVQLVKTMRTEQLVEYLSFDYAVCNYMLELVPGARVAYLNGDQPPAQLAADRLTGLDYHYGILMLKPDWIGEAQQKKLTVNVWTVNDQMSMKWFLDQNVDFITTDEPELLLDLLK